MKKILFKNLKWYEDIEGLSATAMSYSWDRLTKKFINNSIDRWRMQLEKEVEEGSDHIVQLVCQRLMIPRTFLWLLICFSLVFLKCPTCVSNPYILQSVRNLRVQFRFKWCVYRKFRTSFKKCPPSFVTLSSDLIKLWWIHSGWRFFWR